MTNSSTQVSYRNWIIIGGIGAALALIAFLTVDRSRAPSSISVTTRAAHSTARLDGAQSNSTIQPNRTTNGSASSPNWTAKFQPSDDLLKFVKDALSPAQSGDGRANWFIGEALRSCALAMKTYRGVEDPEAQLTQELANMPKAPQWGRDLLAQKTHRCLGLARENPFEGLPSRGGGYPSSYWYGQALADGEPLAQVQVAADAIATVSVARNMSEGEKADTLQAAEANLQSAVESGDPTALYRVGMLLSDPRYSNNPLNGTAVALAACNLGQDCSANNPDSAFFNCKLSGACPADADFAYYLQQSLGPALYAQVDAHAQQIKQAIQAGDWSAVLANLTIEKHP